MDLQQSKCKEIHWQAGAPNSLDVTVVLPWQNQRVLNMPCSSQIITWQSRGSCVKIPYLHDTRQGLNVSKTLTTLHGASDKNVLHCIRPDIIVMPQVRWITCPGMVRVYPSIGVWQNSRNSSPLLRTQTWQVEVASPSHDQCSDDWFVHLFESGGSDRSGG